MFNLLKNMLSVGECLFVVVKGHEKNVRDRNMGVLGNDRLARVKRGL